MAECAAPCRPREEGVPLELQFLCFLHGADEAELLARLDAIDPGLVVLPGRYVDTGDAAALLADPSRFSFSQALRSERRLYLAHRRHAARLVLQPPAGPRPDRHAIDPERSEVFELKLPPEVHGRLAPARLAASLHRFEGHAKVRKDAAFGRWVAKVLRELGAAYPPSSVDFVHVAPGAAAFAAAGGQLTYLVEPVLPAPHAGRRQPQKERLPPARPPGPGEPEEG